MSDCGFHLECIESLLLSFRSLASKESQLPWHKAALQRDKSSWVRLEVGLPKVTWNAFRSRSSPAEPSEDSSAIQRFDCYIVRGNFFLSDMDSTQERPSYRALRFLGDCLLFWVTHIPNSTTLGWCSGAGTFNSGPRVAPSFACIHLASFLSSLLLLLFFHSIYLLSLSTQF